MAGSFEMLATVSGAVFSGPASGFVQPSCSIQLAIVIAGAMMLTRASLRDRGV